MIAVVLACASAARAGDLDWRPPSVHETLYMAAAESLIAVDVMQTLDLKNHRFVDGGDRGTLVVSEANPLLGKHPSDLRLVASAAAGALAAGAVWYAAPPKVRWFVPTFLLVVESVVVYQNARLGMTIHF